MKSIFIIVLFVASVVEGLAQPCRLQNHGLYVLEIIDSVSQQKMHNLSVTLCDRFGNTFQEYFNDGQGDKNTNYPKIDSFFFWENKNFSNKIVNKYVSAFARQGFDGIGDYYICMIPTYSGHFDQLNARRHWHRTNPWQVAQKEIFLYVKISGENIASQVLKIPSGAFYDICSNQLVSSKPLCTIEPIKIVCSNGRASITDNRYGVVQYQLGESVIGNAMILSKIELIDELSGQVLQTIKAGMDDSFKDKQCAKALAFDLSKGIKLFDVDRKNNSNVFNYKLAPLRLFVPAEFKKDTFKNTFNDLETYIVYKFDSASKRYIIDSLLSEPDYLNVFNNFSFAGYNPMNKRLVCLNIARDSNTVLYTYAKWQDNKWQVMRLDKKVLDNNVKIRVQVKNFVQLHPTQYYLRWYDLGRSLLPEMYTMPKLFAQFPKLKSVSCATKRNCTLIDIIDLSQEERAAFFDYLRQNDSLDFVAQIMRGDSTIKYSDGKIKVPIDLRKVGKDDIKAARDLGFLARDWDDHNGELTSSSFYYTDKVIGVDFYEKYQQLVKRFAALHLEINVIELN